MKMSSRRQFSVFSTVSTPAFPLLVHKAKTSYDALFYFVDFRQNSALIDISVMPLTPVGIQSNIEPSQFILWRVQFLRV